MMNAISWKAAQDRQILPVFLSFDLMAGRPSNLMHVLHTHTRPGFIDSLFIAYYVFAKVKVKSFFIDRQNKSSKI